jgi:hypothetical protein
VVLVTFNFRYLASAPKVRSRAFSITKCQTACLTGVAR